MDLTLTNLVLVSVRAGYELVEMEDPQGRRNLIVQTVRDGEDVQVFVDDTGALRAPVGNIILKLSASWTQDQVDSFLEARGLSESVTRMDGFRNGYLVHTLPGAFAIQLAFELGALLGVEFAEPNFWTERVAR